MCAQTADFLRRIFTACEGKNNWLSQLVRNYLLNHPLEDITFCLGYRREKYKVVHMTVQYRMYYKDGKGPFREVTRLGGHLKCC